MDSWQKLGRGVYGVALNILNILHRIHPPPTEKLQEGQQDQQHQMECKEDLKVNGYVSEKKAIC